VKVLLDIVDDFLRLVTDVQFAHVRDDSLDQLAMRVAERRQNVALEQWQDIGQVSYLTFLAVRSRPNWWSTRPETFPLAS